MCNCYNLINKVLEAKFGCSKVERFSPDGVHIEIFCKPVTKNGKLAKVNRYAGVTPAYCPFCGEKLRSEQRYARYGISTWPESQEFVGNPECMLICPPATSLDPTRLDSSYFVPESITGPLESKHAYLRIPFPESQPWLDLESEVLDPNDENEVDTVLLDYDSQDAYVREDFYDIFEPILKLRFEI